MSSLGSFGTLKGKSFNSVGTVGTLFSRVDSASVVVLTLVPGSDLSLMAASKFPTAEYFVAGLLMGEQVHSHFKLELGAYAKPQEVNVAASRNSLYVNHAILYKRHLQQIYIQCTGISFAKKTLF